MTYFRPIALAVAISGTSQQHGNPRAHGRDGRSDEDHARHAHEDDERQDTRGTPGADGRAHESHAGRHGHDEGYGRHGRRERHVGRHGPASTDDDATHGNDADDDGHDVAAHAAGLGQTVRTMP